MNGVGFRDLNSGVAYNGLMFKERVKEHAVTVTERLAAYPDIATTEAQTKNSLIEPFLRCLGYDPSHPEQVTLEVPTELGGKIDYVLTGQANVKIAVEAKKAGVKLSEKETNQLRSYFTFSEAVAGILTNGVDYWLFTDLNKTNVMDTTPYQRVDVKHLTDNDIHHLETLTRSYVQQGTVHEQAQRERYRKLVNQIVTQELNSPSQDFLKLVGRKAGIKPLTKPHLSLLELLVGEAISRYRGPTLPSETSPPERSNTDVPRFTAGQTALQTLENFNGATLFGKPLPVENYTQMLMAVVAELQTRHPNNFAAQVGKEPFVKKTRKWQYISRDPNHLDLPSRDQIDGFYVDVRHRSKEKERRAYLFLEAFGHDPDELLIHTSD